MQFFMEKSVKHRWGCSSPIFDDQKGNTDSKHKTSSFVDLRIGLLKNNSKVILKYISREIEHLFFLEGITKKSAGL